MSDPAPPHVLDAIRARHQLGDAPADALDAAFEVHRIGDVIVKLVAARYRPQFEAERDALPIAARALGAVVPALRGHGDVDGWSYLVSQALPGVTLDRIWAGLDQPARCRILREVGALLAGLHRAPIAGFGGAHADWNGFVAAEAVACIERQRRWGVAAPLVDGIEELLASVDLREPPRVLIHADLTPGNLLVDPATGAITGLIDFGDARLGDARFDVVTPTLFLCRGAAAPLAAFLDGLGLVLDAGLRRRLMAHALIHPFNDLTRFLDVAPGVTTLDQLAAAFWPSPG